MVINENNKDIQMSNHSVYDSESKREDHTKALAFLDPDGGVTVQRYDTMKYRQFDKLTKSQRGFLWIPEEVELVKDNMDFKKLTDHEKHIFTSNLKRQILLDSVQGRYPNLAFLPLVSLPEIEAWIQTWAYSETVHSFSYSHIIQNVYPNSTIVFDAMLNVPEIVACSNDISRNYDELIEKTKWFHLLGEGEFTITGKTRTGESVRKLVSVSEREVKRLLWLTLMSVNILEGVRFYVSFACSFAFAENKKMTGNATIIKLICRDENLHLASTQMLLKTLVKDDPVYAEIAAETHEECIQMFRDAVRQEKDWASYLFKDGSMIGLNQQLLGEYVDYIAHKRMIAVGLPPLTKSVSNPLPWTQKWIAGADVQVAPQETEISSYIVGGTTQDVGDDTFAGFDL